MNDFKIGPQHNPNGTINGGEFATFLGSDGYAVDGTPRVHDVVSLPPTVDGAGQYGHVAIVLEVTSNGTILVEDYNWADTEQYAQHTISAAGCRFAHVEQPAKEDDEVIIVRTKDNGNKYRLGDAGLRHIDGQEDAIYAAAASQGAKVVTIETDSGGIAGIPIIGQ